MTCWRFLSGRMDLVIVVESQPQRVVLATEKTTVETTKSAIDLSDANPTRSHKEVRRPTGNVVVTTRYSN